MAVMIPSTIAHDCSPGERDAFRRLATVTGIDDWIVLHSLDVARHRRQVSGEIDFVIIVPTLGVLCLEIKACSSLRRDGAGAWYYGTDSKPDYRGPFKQASEAMHSIRGRVVKRRPDLSKVVFWSGVLFPYVTFRTESEEWHNWQVIDDAAYRGRPLPELLAAILRRARGHLASCPTAKWFRPDSTDPSADQSSALVQLLRPSFEFFESPKSRMRRLQDEAREYTEEQFVAIDAMQDNARVLYEGPAGTGKTLLALETCRRAHANQRKTLFLCFNRLLGQWLADQAEEMQPEVTTNTLHSFMLSIARVDAQGRPPTFWQDELPVLAAEKLIEQGRDAEFDELVIDEAQDICRDSYLEFLDLLLKGGLKDGRWRFFGDFEKQAIYHKLEQTPVDVLTSRAGSAPRYSLRVNCRNRPRLAAFVRLLGGLEPDYKRVLRPDDRVEPTQKFYSGATGQHALLIETLDEAYRSGFKGSAVVVLSNRNDAGCVAAAVDESPWKDRLRPIRDASTGHVGYCSVHAFKGLEAPFVIVTDIEQVSGPDAEALFYIAITRAMERLVVLASETARMEVIKLLTRTQTA